MKGQPVYHILDQHIHKKTERVLSTVLNETVQVDLHIVPKVLNPVPLQKVSFPVPPKR